MLDRIVEASNASIISAYERRIDKLEMQKALASEKLTSGPGPRRSFDDMFELSMSFLANPWKLWDSGNLILRKTMLRMVFDERLASCRKEGFRTPKTTIPFKVLGDIRMGKCEMAGLTGENSNSIFETLEEWNAYLKAVEVNTNRKNDRPEPAMPKSRRQRRSHRRPSP